MTETEHLEQISSKVCMLYDRLYGANGHTGDIPEIKALLTRHDDMLLEHDGKLKVHCERWKMLRWLGGLGGIGGASGIGALVRTFWGG